MRTIDKNHDENDKCSVIDKDNNKNMRKKEEANTCIQNIKHETLNHSEAKAEFEQINNT